MTVILCGHSFKYETEAVTKLFIPAKRFDFLFVESAYSIPDIAGDRCVLIRNVYSGISELRADCRIGEETAVSSEKVSLSAPDYEHECELAVCRQLYICLSRLTGIRPSWGVLTGVRPVKLISGLLDGGMSEPELKEYMKKRYFVSYEKTELSVKTSRNQKKALEGLPENGFSLYVSIPFCPSRCSYCSFVSQTVGSFLRLIPEYGEKLCEEIRYTAEILKDIYRRPDTVYFGGGTPTTLETEQLLKIMRTIEESFDLSGIREYTVEAGRPDTVTYEKLRAIKSAGCDRVSINPQTLDPRVLEAIGRKHTPEQFFEAYEAAKKVGFKAINTDLISGLPKDTPEGFESTLKRIIGLDPENITVHTLSIKRAADLMQDPDSAAKAKTAEEMSRIARERLTDAGYAPYYLYRQKNQLANLENIGWERGGNPGIYNINMMEEVQTVIAVGAAGATKLAASKDRIGRICNPKFPLEYITRFDETVMERKRQAYEKIINSDYGFRRDEIK